MKVRHDLSISPNPPSEAPNPPGRPVPGATDTVSAKKKTGLALAQFHRVPHPPPDAGTDTSFSSFPGDVSGTGPALRLYHRAKRVAASNGQARRRGPEIHREVRPQPDYFFEPAPLLLRRSGRVCRTFPRQLWILDCRSPTALSPSRPQTKFRRSAIAFFRGTKPRSSPPSRSPRVCAWRSGATRRTPARFWLPRTGASWARIISSQSESRLALGQIWLAMMDAEAGVDSAPSWRRRTCGSARCTRRPGATSPR